MNMKMDIIIFFFNLLFIINNCFAHEYQNIVENTNNHLKVKRDSASGECKYINKFIGNESDECCNFAGITCVNGHITKM